eukprot:GHRR01020780.1.p1 GENE.GHRR01020780.1~~GHRR01020780.1.p1  ORF type:complete len:125 (-),score=42.67 GHRR01020780.1:673-1047(-)
MTLCRQNPTGRAQPTTSPPQQALCCHPAGTIEGVSFQPKDVPIGPVKLQLGSDQVIQGLQDALIGMQQGSKRRILVPPQLGYLSTALQPQPPTFATKRQLANHSSEPLLFEIQLLRVLLESKLT